MRIGQMPAIEVSDLRLDQAVGFFRIVSSMAALLADSSVLHGMGFDFGPKVIRWVTFRVWASHLFPLFRSGGDGTNLCCFADHATVWWDRLCLLFPGI